MAKKFGVVTSATGITSIVVTSFSKAQNAEIAEARDAAGKVTDLKAYSRGETVSIKGYLDGDSVSVKAGDSVTLEGTTYIIESVTVNETNTTFVEVDISARSADTAAISAYSGTVTE